MDEKITVTKEQKRISLLLVIAVIALMITNVFVTIYNRKEYAPLVFVSIGVCCVTLVLTVIVCISTIKYYKKLNDKKRAVIWVFGLFVLCGLEIYMSASAVSDIIARRNVEKTAVLFIKEKYGIEAEADYDRTSSTDGYKWTTVKMTADGKEFIVEQYADTDGNTKLADNYQLDEIEQAVFDEVSRVYPDGTLRDVRVFNDYFFKGVAEKYFDGTNLDEVMSCQHGSITVDFADTEFDLEAPLFKKLDEWKIRPYFASFDTAEHRDEFVASEELGNIYHYDEHYAKYAHYITDRVEYEYGKDGEKGKVVRKSYDIKTNGEFDYLNRIIYENKSGVKKIEQRFAKYADTALGKPVTKVYIWEYSGGSSNFIYYPLEKLNGIAAENIEAAWISDSAGSNNAFGTKKAEVIGDYAVFVLPYYVEEFIIVDTTDTGGTDKEI